jgi:hypothetical protein
MVAKGNNPAYQNQEKNMQVRKVVAGTALAVGVGVAGLMGAGMASADSDNVNANGGTATGSNPSISDTNGYGIVNHMQGDGDRVGFDGLPGGDYNGDANGIGGIRSTQTGAQISATTGTNRVQSSAGDPNTREYQVQDTGGSFSAGQQKKLAP